MGREKNDFTFFPVCPECQAGLGVTRDPVHLIGGNGEQVWNGEAEVKNRSGKLVTKEIKQGCLECLEVLKRSGVTTFIYMDGSPSCGVYRTTLKNTKRGNPPGVFGSLLLDEGFFLIPSSDLQSPLKWWDWRRWLLAFHWFANHPLSSMQELYETWYVLQFLCQELDNTWAREMGRTPASLSKNDFAQFEPTFRSQVLDLLRRPSTTAKKKGKKVEEINSPEFKRNVTTIAKELIKMERTALEDDFLFGASPVIYRGQSRMRALAEQKEV